MKSASNPRRRRTTRSTHASTPTSTPRPSALRAAISSMLLTLPLAAPPAGAAVQFTVTSLSTVTGNTSSSAQGLNAAGLVVGSSYDHAFLWQGGGMQDLGTLGGATSGALGINAAGQVVGFGDLSGNGARYAFLWQAGAMQDLGTLGGHSSSANGINAAGQAVGTSKLSGEVDSHAFLWQSGSMQDLGTLGGANSGATGINDAGQVVGYAYAADNQRPRAFLWQAGRMQDLGGLGGSYGYAAAINRAGQVAGYATVGGDGATHASLWQAGAVLDLGTLGGSDSYGHGINAAGQVVGRAMTSGNAAEHAFLRGAQGGMVDVNALLVAGSGATVTDALGVNDLGQIAATASISGRSAAVLLTPTGSVAWLGGGAGGSFLDAANWELGFAPTRFLDAVIAPAGGQTVYAGADAAVKSLSIGGAAGSSGRPLLVLQYGAVLSAANGVTVQATGTLGGDGRINGDLNNLGTLQPNNLSVSGTLANAGLISGSGYLNTNLNNAATGQLRSGAGDSLRVVGSSHTNAGTLDISGGGTQQYGGGLTNTAGGRILLDHAVLRLDNGLSNFGQVQVGYGGATVYGTVTTGAGGKIILSGNSETTFYDALDIQSGGELRVSGGSSAVFFGTVYQRSGSIFSGSGSKFYEGGLSIGASPGLGTDGGDVSFGSGNTYLEEIGGLAAGTQFDKYIVAGKLGFGGGLKVVWWGGFAGQAGQRFDLFDWGSSEGAFSAIDLSGAPLAAGLQWDTSRLYSTGEIGISAVPEPQSWALLLAGLGLLAWRGGARASRLRVAAAAVALVAAGPGVAAAGVRAVSVEEVLPAKPYKAAMEVFAPSVPGVHADDLIFVGGDGAIGITSITVTNKNNFLKSITVFEPPAGAGRGCGAPVWATPNSFVVMLPASSTVHLAFPSPLVFNAVNGHTCFGLQVNEFTSSVQVMLNGFSH